MNYACPNKINLLFIPDVSYGPGAYRSGQFQYVNTGDPMAEVVIHRNVRIVVLDPDEQLTACCKPGDIAIRTAPDGWWTSFIAADGSVDSYDQPYPSRAAAVGAAKAAAEFGV